MEGASAPNIWLFFMDPILVAERYSHGVRITKFSRELFYKMQGFIEGLSLKEPTKIPGRGMVMELKKKYYGLTNNHRELTIHRNCYDDFVKYLANQNVNVDRIQLVDVPVPVTKPATYEMYEHFNLYEYQVIIHDDAVKPEMTSARIDLQTGKGKTLSSFGILRTLGVKCIVMLPPKYFGLWEKGLRETYKDIGLRFCRVSGSDEMKCLIDRALADDLNEFDIFLISNVSYRNYIEDYEKYGEETFYDTGYNVFPQQFHQLLGVGLQINDEIQEDPGLLFRIDMYTNVAKQVYLSATPFTGNPYVTRMIDVMLPERTKVRLPSYDVYINVMGLFYNDIKVRPKDYLTPYKNTYNHARYESVMLKNPARLEAYMQLLYRVAEGVFLKDRLPGQKCLFLFATVAFIEYVTKQFKKKFKDLNIEIGAHYSGSDYSKLMTNDLTNSTIKSSGTGVDIKNLREIVRCHATNSKKDNIQIAGRGRKLKDFPEVSPRLTVLICQQIPHQMRYGAEMRDHFDGKTNTVVYRRMS